MDFFLTWILPFVLGVPASIVAADLYARIVRYMDKQPKVEIEGVWGEYVPKSTSRNYTIGRISFDKKKSIYVFDGTNYYNDGRAFCHFETVASHVDISNRRFYYIFSAHVEGDFHKVYFGFGVVNLILNSENALIPTDGHYLSADVDTEAMTHSMQLLERVSYKRDREATQSIKLVKRY